MINGIVKILSFTNDIDNDGLVLEKCGDYVEDLKGFFITLPREKFVDMCNLMTVVYNHSKEVCFKTFEEGDDNQIIQLCNTFKEKETYTSMFIKSFGGVSNLISSSVGSFTPTTNLENPLDRLTTPNDTTSTIEDVEDDWDDNDLVGVGSFITPTEKEMTQKENVVHVQEGVTPNVDIQTTQEVNEDLSQGVPRTDDVLNSIVREEIKITKEEEGVLNSTVREEIKTTKEEGEEETVLTTGEQPNGEAVKSKSILEKIMEIEEQALQSKSPVNSRTVSNESCSNESCSNEKSEGDLELINRLTQEIDLLKKTIIDKENEILSKENYVQNLLQIIKEKDVKIVECDKSIQLLQGNIDSLNFNYNELQTEFIQTKPFVDCFYGVDVSSDDIAMCQEIVESLNPEDIRKVVLNVIKENGLDISDKGKCLFVIKLVDSIYNAGLFN